MATASMGLPPVTLFSDLVGSNNQKAGGLWRSWLKRTKNYIKAIGVKDDERKRAMLLHLIGPRYEEEFDKLGETTGNTFDDAVKTLTNHFIPKVNIEFEKAQFRGARQNDKETIDEYHNRLKQLALTCKFTDTAAEIK